jgi:hypothetical protein
MIILKCILEKWCVKMLVDYSAGREIPAVTEPKDLLSCLHKTAIRPYPKLGESSPYSHLLFTYNLS